MDIYAVYMLACMLTEMLAYIAASMYIYIYAAYVLACMLAELLAYSAPVNTSAELLPHSKAMPFEGNAIQPRRKERSSAQ